MGQSRSRLSSRYGEKMKKEYCLSVSTLLRSLLLHCNDRCCPDCCHSSAFTIEDFNVRNWFGLQHTGYSDEISQEISVIVDGLQHVESEVRFVVRNLESVWKVDEAIQFFLDLEEVVFNVLCKSSQTHGHNKKH